MTAKARHLRKAAVAHLLRAAAGVTGRDSFVLVGTGAVVAQLKAVPLDLMETRAVDLSMPDDSDADALSDLIDGTIGEGSPFDEAFGYHAHGVGALTACLPDDGRARAVRFTVPNLPGLTCLCPDPDDVALSKLCAWRDKDRDWLRPASAPACCGSTSCGRAPGASPTRTPPTRRKSSAGWRRWPELHPDRDPG